MWSFSVDKINWQQSAEQLRGAWKLSNVCTSICFSGLLLHMLLWRFHRVSALTEQFCRASGPKGGASHGGTKLCVAPAQQEIGSNVFECPRNIFISLPGAQHTISREDTQIKKVSPCEMWVAITLRQLGTNNSYRTVERLFGVSRSSVCLIINEVCQAFVNKLPPIREGDVLDKVHDRIGIMMVGTVFSQVVLLHRFAQTSLFRPEFSLLVQHFVTHHYLLPLDQDLCLQITYVTKFCEHLFFFLEIFANDHILK